jgi:integrase
VREIQRGHIKLFLGEKRRQGYAKNSVRLMKAAPFTLLSDVADDGIIAANPAFQLGRRKASHADRLTPAERPQKVRPMSWEQRDAFLAAAADESRYGALFTVLAKAGLRPSEGFALKLGDLDVRAHTLRVERAWVLGRLKATKTYEERTVDLTPDLVRSLERHVAWVRITDPARSAPMAILNVRRARSVRRNRCAVAPKATHTKQQGRDAG